MALGILESGSYTGIIFSADLMLKETNVKLVSFSKTEKSGILIFEGDITSVKIAEDLIKSNLNNSGNLFNIKSIANPDKEVYNFLGISSEPKIRISKTENRKKDPDQVSLFDEPVIEIQEVNLPSNDVEESKKEISKPVDEIKEQEIKSEKKEPTIKDSNAPSKKENLSAPTKNKVEKPAPEKKQIISTDNVIFENEVQEVLAEGKFEHAELNNAPIGNGEFDSLISFEKNETEIENLVDAPELKNDEDFEELNHIEPEENSEEVPIIENIPESEQIESPGISISDQEIQEENVPTEIENAPKLIIENYDLAELENYNVQSLRKLAREFENFPIKGRQISMANKQVLLEYFQTLK